MSSYPIPSDPTSCEPASTVPLGDPLPKPMAHVNTPTLGPAEDRERIKADGLACLNRLHSDLTFEDWLGVGAALTIVTSEALVEVNAFKWDRSNRQLVKEFNRRWDEYESGAGGNCKPLSKQERSALREIIANPAILAWRNTLTSEDKRRLNYPKAVIRSFNAKKPAGERKQSPQAKLKAANIELQEELHRLKKRGDGNGFTSADTVKDIVNAIIGTFEGLSTKTARVEAIARELNAWIKQQKIAAS